MFPLVWQQPNTDDSRDLTHWLSCYNTGRWFFTILPTCESATAICYRLWISFLQEKHMFPQSFLPTLLVSLPFVPFASPRGSTAMANIIKLTTIKITPNYCEPLHWHPRSILSWKRGRLIVWCACSQHKGLRMRRSKMMHVHVDQLSV